MRTLLAPAGLLITVGLLSSCAGEAEEPAAPSGCDGGKCDDVDPADFACQAIADRSGRGTTNPAILETLNDPVARLVLQDPRAGCPTNLDEIMDKLRETDAENCKMPVGVDPDTEDAQRRAGIRSRIVTERAQLSGGLESPASGRAPTRAVITRECSDRNTFELIFSLLGVTEQGLPQNNTEMIGFDSEAGVFNYYTLRNGQWAFHGNSQDFVTPGNDAECRACHTGGGLIMKEINAPWVHWEGDTTTPGLDPLFDTIENLGSRSDGIDMEGPLVREGNRGWNQSRIAAAADPENTDLHGGSMKTLLAPLFCASEFNLQSAGNPGGPLPPFPGPLPPFPGPAPFADISPDVAADRTGAVNLVPADFFADPLLAAGGVPVDPVEYQQALLEIGSRIQGRDGAVLQRRADPEVPEDEDGPALDTFFGFTYPERADSDRDYVDNLQNIALPEGLGAGVIIDREFARDVLAIDFTRPVFSRARCELLEFVPTFEELAAVDLSSEPPPQVQESHPCCGPKSPRPGQGDFDPDDHLGCAEDQAVEDAVCAADPFCCGIDNPQGFWDATCGRKTQTVAGGFCEDASQQEESETTKRLRLAMAEKLAATSGRGTPDSAAAQLLANLETPDQSNVHEARVAEFIGVCRDRAGAEDEAARMKFLVDIFTVAARMRTDAERFSPVLEFAETMATDDLNPSPDARLDPTTCELVE